MTGYPERGLKRLKPSLAQKTFPQDQKAPAVADHGDGTGQRTRLFLQRIPFHEVLQSPVPDSRARILKQLHSKSELSSIQQASRAATNIALYKVDSSKIEL